MCVHLLGTITEVLKKQKAAIEKLKEINVIYCKCTQKEVPGYGAKNLDVMVDKVTGRTNTL
jgi:hypothetical protein